MSDLPTGPSAIEAAPPLPQALAPTINPAPANDRIAKLRAAGFSDDEVSAWSQQKRATLGGAGFNDREIDDYLGNRQPGVSQGFFDRAVKGASLRPDTQPSMLGELYRGAVRSGTSTLYSVEKLANIIETKLGQVTGSEAIKRTAAADVAALAKREAESQAENKPGVEAVSDIGGAGDATHYVIGKLGELAPTVAEYLTMGVPRMIVLGALGGGLRAGEQNNDDPGAIATGAALGAAAAGAPAPFLNGALGKGVVQGVVKGIIGMSAVGAAQTLAEPLPKAVATGQYEAPSAAQIAEGAASGAIAGAVFGGVGGFARRAPLTNGELHDQPIGGLPTSDDFANAARSLTGNTPAPHVNAKLGQLWEEHGVHPAEVAHDAAVDPVTKQQMLSSNDALPSRYTGPPKNPSAWFGDSKVVDEAGDPMRVYHGTPGGAFDRFDMERAGANLDSGFMGRGAYFTDRPDLANYYATTGGQEAPTVIPAFLSLQNPFEWGTKTQGVRGLVMRGERLPEAIHDAVIERTGFKFDPSAEPDFPAERHLSDAVRQVLIDKGYDGVIADLPTGGREYVAFSPEQIESAIGMRKPVALPPAGGGAGGKPPTEPPTGTPPAGAEPPSKPPSVDEAKSAILSRLSIGESDNGRPWSWSRLYTAVVDRLNPFRVAVRKLTDGEPLAVADDPYKLARLYAGVSGKADRWLNHSTFDFNTYAETGKSLKDIIAPVARDLDGFRAYGTALRAIELEGRDVKTGMDIAAARVVADAGHEKYAPIMGELVDFQNKLATYLRDAGVLSPAGYAAMREANPLYLPFQRVFGDNLGDVIPEAKGIGGASLQGQNPIHRILGSERRVIDPLESVVRNTYLSLAMAERNAVGNKLVGLMEAASGKEPPASVDTITVLRNGTKETHEVDAGLASAMKGLDEESANTMLRLLGVPARMLRTGAVLTPDFMVRNVLRDFSAAFVNTTKGVFSPVDTARGLYSSIVKDKYFQDWLAGGGANAALVSLDRRYLQQNLAELTRETGLMSRSWNVVRHPIDTLRVLSELTEHATRLGEFRAAQDRELASGAGLKEATQAAAYASREITIDFARRGAQTRSMNMITAFWNAQVQGIDRLGRAIIDNPVGTGLKIAGGITLPSVLLWWANHDDPRWKEIPDWERDLFWIVMTENHMFRIPKPFELGVLFGSGAERALDAFVAHRPEGIKHFANSLVGALTPGVIPTAAVPVVEQWANRSSFTDRTLIPDTLEKQLPEYQFSPHTTEASKALGHLLSSVPGVRSAAVEPDSLGGAAARTLTSPILMENYIRAWTGGLGTYALQISDAALRKAGALPDPPKPEDTLADIPVVKAFAVRYPTASAQSIQDFYDAYKERKTYLDTFKAQAKAGDAEAALKVMQIGGGSMFAILDPIHQALGLQSQMVRNIWKNPDMSPSDKRQQIDDVYRGMTEIAQVGMQAMRSTANLGQ